MKKHLLSAFMAIFCFGAWGQVTTDAVALCENVRHGKLDNGLTYYLLRNGKPKNRAEFHIVQKVGSILEEDDQRGLAHFLEHMAFNGTKNFPGKSLISYLEHNGMKFGDNINAYTSIDETIYSITDVPARQGLLDSCLLILHDWSGFITLDGDEIDAERKVIHEEWRAKRNALSRMTETLLPQLFPGGNKYAARLPIGLMEVVDNFPHNTLRKYYDKWYRPDLQGIIVVGDIDVDRMEQTIRSMWRDIPHKKNPAERTYQQVPASNDTIVAIAHDNEARTNTIKIMYKRDDYDNAIRSYRSTMYREYVTMMVASLLDDRIKESPAATNGSLTSPRASDGYYSISATKRAFTLSAQFNAGEWRQAIQSLVGELKRALVYGFESEEIKRMVAAMDKSAVQTIKTKDETTNSHWGRQLQRHFLNNTPAPCIEEECNLYRSFNRRITPAEADSILKRLVTTNDIAISMQGEERHDAPWPTAEEVKAELRKAWAADVERLQTKEAIKPLMPSAPEKGSIVNTKTNEKYGTKELLLSNGAKVILKHTGNKTNNVILKAFSWGGNSLYTEADHYNYSYINSVIPLGGLGNLSNQQLAKTLEGRTVNYRASVGMTSETIDASCATGDEKTLMQCVYLRMTSARADTAQFALWAKRQRRQIDMRKQMPQTAFGDSLSRMMYDYNIRVAPQRPENIDKIDYDRLRQIYLERFANAADFTFVIVGNYNETTIENLIETYIASLPSTRTKKEQYRDVMPRPKKGNKQMRMEVKMQTPKTTVVYQSLASCQWSPVNHVAATTLQQILEMLYTEEIREKDGGTYGIGVQLMLTRCPKNRLQLSVNLDTNKEQAESAANKIRECIDRIAKYGPDPMMMQKSLEYQQKTLTNYVGTNDYWMQAIMQNIQYNTDDALTPAAALKQLTPADIRKMARLLSKSGNTTLAVLDGVKADF
ncbi:MAG: insulinase family protein [Prevotella sp.]|nr:insulinase family protein [Prevotella sp.]